MIFSPLEKKSNSIIKYKNQNAKHFDFKDFKKNFQQSWKFNSKQISNQILKEFDLFRFNYMNKLLTQFILFSLIYYQIPTEFDLIQL